ncbi:hypothetical protein FZEAL_3584 [Fusarium zealandicum]|uniref:Pro-apoptotic serine protease NMA111 n=1 Tax=Fusarium zealandicum TaxID=1053134 RepID=A0A8H4XMU0_9HYPO|nr:hypothetical protein FZEAL_3584 [Fusarium zealandicum]
MSRVVDLTGSSPLVSNRETRSSTHGQLVSSPPSPPSPNTPQHIPDTISSKPKIEHLSSAFSLSIPHQRTLRGKRNPVATKRIWLSSHTVPLPQDVLNALTSNETFPFNPVDATLVFAQEQAGTAVCISPDGVILTCSHCVAESHSKLTEASVHTLISSTGALITARVIAWDPARDLALLIIEQSELPHRPFPYIRIASSPPKFNTRLLCVGHPGSEDLEAERRGVPTEYDTLVLSEGTFRGLVPGQDPQNNSEIGALKHSCWTYWGHSGAGLFERRTGNLVGVHSSWDEDTGTRRGVPLEAVVAFLEEFEGGYRGRKGADMGKGWRWFVRG